ncbi:MAG TPA: hydroxyacylglutathione hydrolase [Rhizomicrobium sp.]
MPRLQIEIVPCLSDNYAYLVHDPKEGVCAVVDPSEPGPVLAALDRHGLKLTHILNTHHHFDHTGGNIPLQQQFGARIVGPEKDRERIPGIDVGVGEESVWSLGSHRARILEIPAHTRGHIAFAFEDDQAVFTGDTLFALGCGRLFEGTPDMMWTSLSKLMALDDRMAVYCGHEYTLSNGRFALTLEAGNRDLRSRMAEVQLLRTKNEATIPSTIDLEKRTNPFLRPDSPEIRHTLNMAAAANVEVLAEMRRRKDAF